MKSISNQIRNAMLKIKGVKSVHVERRVTYEVKTFVDNYRDDKLRNAIYQKEADIMDENQDLDFDFHVVPTNRGENKDGIPPTSKDI